MWPLHFTDACLSQDIGICVILNYHPWQLLGSSTDRGLVSEAAAVEFSVVWCLTAWQLQLRFAGRRKKSQRHERYSSYIIYHLTSVWKILSSSCIPYSGDSVSRCLWLSLASACQFLASETEAECGWLLSYRALLCTWCPRTKTDSKTRLV